MNKERDKASHALRNEGMSSATGIPNTTAPRKVRDMPEDDGYKEPGPEKDYWGPARKDR